MSIQFTHRCCRCKVEKPVDQFHKNLSRAAGLSQWCKSCRKAWDGTNRPNYRKYVNKYRRTHRATKLIGTIRTRAKDAGLEFDLDQYIPQIQARIDAGSCEMSGVQFDLDSGRNFASPSIDRIDSSAGYTYANVRVVCFAMNCALNEWGEEVLEMVMTAWLARRLKSKSGQV